MRPYYEHGGITIYHGDCREILPQLALSADVDAVVTDPPYGATVFTWDQWPADWLKVLPGNALWCFGMLRMFMEHAPDFKAAGWKLAQDVIWKKHNGSNFHNDRFRRVHEQVVHFYRGRWSEILHQVQMTNDASSRTLRRKAKPAHLRKVNDGSYRSFDGGPRMMLSVMEVRSTHGHALHPTQKPLGIIRPLIAYSSKAGIILDPFAGAGSTLVTAKELGRRAIGIEAQECHCEAAAVRLSQEVLQIAN